MRISVRNFPGRNDFAQVYDRISESGDFATKYKDDECFIVHPQNMLKTTLQLSFFKRQYHPIDFWIEVSQDDDCLKVSVVNPNENWLRYWVDRLGGIIFILAGFLFGLVSGMEFQGLGCAVGLAMSLIAVGVGLLVIYEQIFMKKIYVEFLDDFCEKLEMTE